MFNQAQHPYQEYDEAMFCILLFKDLTAATCGNA